MRLSPRTWSFSSLRTLFSSTFSNPDDSSSVGFSVLSNLINVIWALSGVASDLAGVGVVAGLFKSAVGFASTFAGGNSVPTNPITAPFNQMVSDLVNGFSNTLAANNSNEAAVFSDYGLLMTIGGWLEEGAWLVGPDDVTEAITLASRAYAFYVNSDFGSTCLVCLFRGKLLLESFSAVRLPDRLDEERTATHTHRQLDLALLHCEHYAQ